MYTVTTTTITVYLLSLLLLGSVLKILNFNTKNVKGMLIKSNFVSELLMSFMKMYPYFMFSFMHFLNIYIFGRYFFKC